MQESRNIRNEMLVLFVRRTVQEKSIVAADGHLGIVIHKDKLGPRSLR